MGRIQWICLLTALAIVTTFYFLTAATTDTHYISADGIWHIRQVISTPSRTWSRASLQHFGHKHEAEAAYKQDQVIWEEWE